MDWNPETKDTLLKLSDDALDDSVKPLIQKWSNPPTSMELLEVLDKCIYASLTSGFVVTVLEINYDAALKREGKKHEDNVPFATWRKEPC